MVEQKLNETSWHYRNGFKNQFERTYRWLIRLQDIQDGKFVEVRQDFSLQRDYLLAFFNCCFSIRDWVKDEPEWSSIAILVNGDPFLMICRDIANVSKHKTLHSPSVDADFAFMTQMSPSGHKIALAISAPKLVAAIEKAYEETGKKYGAVLDLAALHANLDAVGIPTKVDIPLFMDALILAQNCVKAWEFYLVKANLLSAEEIKTIKENAFYHKGF